MSSTRQEKFNEVNVKMNTDSGSIDSGIFNLESLMIYCPCLSEAIKTAKAHYPVGFFILVYRYPKGSDNLIVNVLDLSRNPPAILKPVTTLKVNEYLLFSWDNVTGNDSERLLRFLKDNLDIGWARNAEISKTDDNKTIQIRKRLSNNSKSKEKERQIELQIQKEGKNLPSKAIVRQPRKDENLVEIMIDEKKATLKISDGRILDLKVKKENGNIYVYVEGLEDIKKRIEKHLSEINKIIGSYRSANKYKLEQFPENEKEQLKSMVSGEIDKITTAGEELAKWLPSLRQLSDGITSDLQNQDENKQIWIFGEDEKVFGLWEWIYLGLPNTNSREEFLGDKFSIIRVPEEYKFDNEITNLTINKSNILLLIDEDSYAEMQRECFEILTQLKEIKLKDNLKRWFKSLLRQKPNDFDIIHLAAGRLKIKRHDLKNIVKPETNTANFVFLNICECENVSDKFRSEEEFISGLAKNKTIPWIRTCFKIDGYFAYHFAIEFYRVFLNDEKNVSEAVREARKASNEYSINNLGFGNIWRLAYVMGGNPFAYIIGRDMTSKQGS